MLAPQAHGAGVGGHPGVFSIFLDRAPRFFLRIFTGNFWIFLRTRCPPAEICSRFSLFGGFFFWPFSGFPSFYPHCHGVILKKWASSWLIHVLVITTSELLSGVKLNYDSGPTVT